MLAKVATNTPGEISEQFLLFNLATDAGELPVSLTAAKAGPVVFDVMAERRRCVPYRVSESFAYLLW